MSTNSEEAQPTFPKSNALNPVSNDSLTRTTSQVTQLESANRSTKKNGNPGERVDSPTTGDSLGTITKSTPVDTLLAANTLTQLSIPTVVLTASSPSNDTLQLFPALPWISLTTSSPENNPLPLFPDIDNFCTADPLDFVLFETDPLRLGPNNPLQQLHPIPSSLPPTAQDDEPVHTSFPDSPRTGQDDAPMDISPPDSPKALQDCILTLTSPPHTQQYMRPYAPLDTLEPYDANLNPPSIPPRPKSPKLSTFLPLNPQTRKPNLPPPASPRKLPSLLHLNGSSNLCKSLLPNLTSTSPTAPYISQTHTTLSGFLTHMRTAHPTAIILADGAALFPPVLHRIAPVLKEYVNAGGAVVVCGLAPSFLRLRRPGTGPSAANLGTKFFGTFGLAWRPDSRPGLTARSVLVKNGAYEHDPSSPCGDREDGPVFVEDGVVFLENVGVRDAVFVDGGCRPGEPEKTGYWEDPEGMKRRTAVALATVGTGLVGYVGFGVGGGRLAEGMVGLVVGVGKREIGE